VIKEKEGWGAFICKRLVCVPVHICVCVYVCVFVCAYVGACVNM